MFTLHPPNRHRHRRGSDVGAGRTQARLRNQAPVAVTMFPLPPLDERAALAALCGAGEVRDSTDTDTADVVVLRPSSPQTVMAVRRRFPEARLVVIDEPASGVHVAGPVTRLCDAGVDAYLALPA